MVREEGRRWMMGRGRRWEGQARFLLRRRGGLCGRGIEQVNDDLRHKP